MEAAASTNPSGKEGRHHLPPWRLALSTSRPWRKLLPGLLVFCLWVGNVFAAGADQAETTLNHMADTRNMKPGLARAIGDLYNGDPWLYGLVVVLTMVVQGTLLGLVFDRLISLLGIRLGKIDHHE